MKQAFSRVFIVFVHPFEQAFQVVADSGHQEAFVGQFQSSGIHPPHAEEVHQGADHRLYSSLPELFHSTCLSGLHAQMHCIIEVPGISLPPEAGTGGQGGGKQIQTVRVEVQFTGLIPNQAEVVS